MHTSSIIIKLCFAILISSLPANSYKSYEVEIDNNVCYKDNIGDREGCSKNSNPTRYIFFDVNPSEGFNLRRDVFGRFAVLARQLASSSDPRLKNFKLVLPPWSHLHHWSYSEKPELVPWSYYFDMDNLKSYAPCIEMYEFFKEIGDVKGKVVIDEVYVMKNFDEMMRTGKFVNKMDLGQCEDDEHISYFFYRNITSHNVRCLKFHGPSTLLTELLLTSQATTILFTHAEVALHPTFGDSVYWMARRSLRFNKEMRTIAKHFRSAYLSSSDESDNIAFPKRWEDDKPHRDAIGGPYLAIHVRRRDFFIGRPKELPSLEFIANQAAEILQKLGLSIVFLATDAPSSDVETLRFYLPKNIMLVRFIPDSRFLEHYKDGGTAIIDQIICAHSRYFMGTAESTFTFRIFEEREILGFPVEATFNFLCADKLNCKKPSLWKIVYD